MLMIHVRSFHAKKSKTTEGLATNMEKYSLLLMKPKGLTPRSRPQYQSQRQHQDQDQKVLGPIWGRPRGGWSFGAKTTTAKQQTKRAKHIETPRFDKQPCYITAWWLTSFPSLEYMEESCTIHTFIPGSGLQDQNQEYNFLRLRPRPQNYMTNTTTAEHMNCAKAKT